MESPELEGPHQDHPVHLLALHRHPKMLPWTSMSQLRVPPGSVCTGCAVVAFQCLEEMTRKIEGNKKDVECQD